jgi:RNA polymerase-interacting CarD/CdnL/TRCF family regulator
MKTNWIRVYKIIQSPVSKKFENLMFSRRALMLQEKIKAYNPYKAAEVLRDIRTEFAKNKNSSTWNRFLSLSIGTLTAMLKKDKNISELEAKNILIAKFTRKSIKSIKTQRKKALN